ncbi:hypothetical protein MKW98_025203 [Papaver atlanticum]|uniref:Uncharacterized protein n=1 Tax=Papaver atlanticum TaxID=357466 RepID=A0AAD4X6J4_9MAGN|nr:hypothetical protein MKW98_025203 [Papaver atlanticum]
MRALQLELSKDILKRLRMIGHRWNELPRLVYFSREKRPGYNTSTYLVHAMKTLVRILHNSWQSSPKESLCDLCCNVFLKLWFIVDFH